MQSALPHVRSFLLITQLDHVGTTIQDRPIYSEATLRNFDQDTVDNFVEKIIEVLRGDETLRQEFGIEGRVAFYDRTNSTSLDDSLQQMHLNDAPHQPTNTNRGRGGRRREGETKGTESESGSLGKATQSPCRSVLCSPRGQIPVYAVEFKAPLKPTVAELVAGLHKMDLARDVMIRKVTHLSFMPNVLSVLFSLRYSHTCTV